MSCDCRIRIQITSDSVCFMLGWMIAFTIHSSAIDVLATVITRLLILVPRYIYSAITALEWNEIFHHSGERSWGVNCLWIWKDWHYACPPEFLRKQNHDIIGFFDDNPPLRKTVVVRSKNTRKRIDKVFRIFWGKRPDCPTKKRVDIPFWVNSTTNRPKITRSCFGCYADNTSFSAYWVELVAFSELLKSKIPACLLRLGVSQHDGIVL